GVVIGRNPAAENIDYCSDIAPGVFLARHAYASAVYGATDDSLRLIMGLNTNSSPKAIIGESRGIVSDYSAKSLYA
ncbi:MAG: hypothetical protein KDI33_06500, partial [Halioglobus sp.]|nr:hypothetical protein [Halioglobus sp.]